MTTTSFIDETRYETQYLSDSGSLLIKNSKSVAGFIVEDLSTLEESYLI